MNEIRPRTVYLLKRKNRPDDGTEIYVGSTLMDLKNRLCSHRCPSSYMRELKLYKKMRGVGVDNWEIVPLLTFTCDKKTILEFEKEWIKILNADLNMNLPVRIISKKEYRANHHHNNVRNKIHHCNVCNESFGQKTDLQRHFESLKHQRACLNSLD